MKTHTLLLASAVVAVPCIVALRAPSTHIRFAPSEGSSLTKTFESKVALTLDEYTMTGTGAQSPELEQTLSMNQRVTVTDEFTKTRDGAPLKLARSFDELHGESAISSKFTVLGQVKTDDKNLTLKSELEGKKVLFAWNAEKSEYDKVFDPAQDEVKVLKDLTEDMDFRALLPTGEVKEGDAWDIPLALLKNVLTPGGALALVPEDADESTLQMGSEMGTLSNMTADKMEGTAKAKLTSVKDVDGVACALIHVDLKVHSAVDMTESARNMLKEIDAGGLEIEHVDVETSFEGEGELLWDIAGGHFRTFDLSGQTTIKTDQGMKIEVNGRSLTLGQTREMSGPATYSAKAK